MKENKDRESRKEEEKSGVNEQQKRKGKREIQRGNQETKGARSGCSELWRYCGSFGLWAVGVIFLYDYC